MKIEHCVEFTLGNLTSYLPTKTPVNEHDGDFLKTKNGDFFIVDEVNYPQYISIGFNESYHEVGKCSKLLHRIPIKSIPTAKSGGSTMKYSRSGILENVVNNADFNKFVKKNMPNAKISSWLVADPFSAFMVEFRVPVASFHHHTVMTRQGKITTCYADQMLKEKTTYLVEMKNRNRQTMIQFNVTIESSTFSAVPEPNDGCDWPSDTQIKEELQKCSYFYEEFRHLLRQKMREETEHYRDGAAKTSAKFTSWGDGMKFYDVYSSHAFQEDRPTNSFLFAILRRINEQFFERAFQLAMLYRLTEYGLDLDVNVTKMYKTLPLREKKAVYVDMCGANSSNIQYVSDLVLDPSTGVLTQTDDYAHVCEASGDCDDLSRECQLTSEEFIRLGRELRGDFKSEALREMWRHALKYVCSIGCAGLNRPSSKTPSLVNHVPVVYHHKKWLFDHIDLKRITDPTVVDALLKLKEAEEHAGNLETYVVHRNGGSREEYPMFLMGEGTGLIYPYQVDDYSPKDYLEKKTPPLGTGGGKMGGDSTLQFPGFKHRVYQSKNYQYHMRYILLVTNFFITHPVSPTNIPSLYLSYSDKNERGVASNDMYRENSESGRRESKIILLPQTNLIDISDSVFVMSMVSRDKFYHTPLWADESLGAKMSDVCLEEGRCDWFVNSDEKRKFMQELGDHKVTSMRESIRAVRKENPKAPKLLNVIPPNIPLEKWDKRFIKDVIPKSFHNLSFGLIASDSYRTFRKNVDETRIRGNKFFKLQPETTFYIVWYE